MSDSFAIPGTVTPLAPLSMGFFRQENYSGFPFPSPKVSVLASQLCPTLCYPVDYSPPGSSVHGILQAKILEWIPIPSSRGLSQPRDRTGVSCITGRFFTVWPTQKWKWKLLSNVRLFATPWTAAYQAPLPMGFSRQEYWSGSPVPSAIFPLPPLN